MRKYKVGDRLLVKLSGGRIVEATAKAVVASAYRRILVFFIIEFNAPEVRIVEVIDRRPSACRISSW
jgi:hypothetical protein